MGRLNKRALLTRLQVMGSASRAHLAKSLGLSAPTVGKIVDEMLKLGVLEEIEAPTDNESESDAPLTLGRPGRIVQFDRSCPRFVGLHLGVSQTSLVSLPMAVDGEDKWEVSFPTPTSAREWQAQLRKSAQKVSSDNLLGVIVSVPGIVDEKHGQVIYSPNIHWIEGDKLSKLIRGIWNAPVTFVQEARALALGHQSSAPEQEDFLLVDFSEGVGGAPIVAGKLYMCSLPMSGELGHTLVMGNKRQCGCGAMGCVETLVSIPGLLESFTAASPNATPTWQGLIAVISHSGLPLWLEDALDAAASAITGALNVCGLRRVVMTGSITELPPVVFAHLERAIERGSLWARFGKIEVQCAPRRRTAGLVAVGIDRLVVPLPESERSFETTQRQSNHPSKSDVTDFKSQISNFRTKQGRQPI